MSMQTRDRSTAGRWTEADVPDQSGRTAVITGGNSGIGFEAARVLATRGARLILGCRDRGKAHDAVTRIRAAATGADVRVVPLDLASLESVRAAAGQIRSTCERIDLVVNNAGVMMPPYGRTTDGFELQFGINHLGHFALTGLLIDRLAALPGARVVTVSSNNHRDGQINFDDLQSERGYRRMAGYSQSKLANLMFTYELQRRLHAAGTRNDRALRPDRAAARAARRDRRARHAPGRDRPRRARRRLLRAGPLARGAGLPCPGQFKRAVPRRRRAAPAVAGIGAAHGCRIRDLKPRAAGTTTATSRPRSWTPRSP